MIEVAPEIGKSLFIFYFISEKVQEVKENEEPIPIFPLIGRSLSAGVTQNKYSCALRVDDEGNGMVQVPTVESIPDYLLKDFTGEAYPYYTVQYINEPSITDI
mmetsp:Transcript_73426/g.144112  ORF Transcript_73426/g.144112 Transcript_73426/m.144112 type:complete len:103 (-) Transcript_73426:443-751(-)